jgi:hypothetical protein
MPTYRFHVEDGPLEDHELNLPDDTAAVHEALNTASGLLRDIDLSRSGEVSQFLEIKESGQTVFRIEVHATRNR